MPTVGPTKGAATRTAIVDEAADLASRVGLDGLTIGTLAAATRMSKSGLYAHFASKEALQLDVITRARERYTDVVVRPALLAPRGEPRLRELFERSLDWQVGSGYSGGCVILTAGTEFDDQPGVLRDEVVRAERDRLDTFGTAIRLAVDAGHLSDTVDVGQLTFEIEGIVLSHNRATRLLSDPAARAHARTAFERLLDAARPD